MKRLDDVLGKRLVQTLTFIFATLITALVAIIACGAGPKKLGSVPSEAGAAHHLGVTLNDAGMPVNDAGQVAIFLDASVPAVLGEPPIDHCAITSVSIDPPTGNFAAYVSCGSHNRRVDGQLTQAQINAVYNLVRNAAAAGGIQ